MTPTGWGYTEVPSPGVVAFIGYEVQAKLAWFVSVRNIIATPGDAKDRNLFDRSMLTKLPYCWASVDSRDSGVWDLIRHHFSPKAHTCTMSIFHACVMQILLSLG